MKGGAGRRALRFPQQTLGHRLCRLIGQVDRDRRAAESLLTRQDHRRSIPVGLAAGPGLGQLDRALGQPAGNDRRLRPPL